MDKDELTRLAGEQALLRRDERETSVRFEQDKRALRMLWNDIDMGQRGWLANGQALLGRLDADQEALAALRERIRQLGTLTGL